MRVDGRPGRGIPVSDRGFQYSDGLFETIAIRRGRPTLWERHMGRLLDGCRRLGLPPPDPHTLLEETLQEAADRERGIVKIILTRGSGTRGYRAPVPVVPRRILDFHPWPSSAAHLREQGVRVRMCATRLPIDPVLAGLKTLGRLHQVLARSEWTDPAIHEGLMQDAAGHLLEGTMTNLFLVRDGRLLTPALSLGGVAGVLRGLVLDVAAELGIGVVVQDLVPADLEAAEALFLTNSVIGIWPVRRLGDLSYNTRLVPFHLVERVMHHAFLPGDH